MEKISNHVLPGLNGGWVVRKRGSKRAARLFNTRVEAVDYGREISMKQKSELVIHQRDGTVLRKDDYSVEPCPPGKQA